MLVVPVVNCRDAATAASQIGKAAAFFPPTGGWLHIDVSDGEFTPEATWGDPAALRNLKESYPALHFEIHLMVQDPEAAAEGWLEAGAERVIVHLEAMKDPGSILDAARRHGAEVMLAIAPATPVENLMPYFSSFSAFQVLAVTPGPVGQRFSPVAVDKVRFLQRYRPTALIEVDGGVTPEVCKLVKEAGADAVASATYIFGNPDPKRAYEELMNC
jgi:ribulose-phosphate 3-epimerase